MGQIRQTEDKENRTQASEIELIFEEKIRSGAYPVGSKLPTVRKLAEEFGVSKNTTVRAYQALRRKGYLNLIRGSGAFIKRRELVVGNCNQEWQEQLDRLIAEAKRKGISHQTILDKMRLSTDRILGSSHLRICFVECNTQDIEAMSGDLRAGVGYSFEGILLSEVIARPEEIDSRFDLIVTSFFHLSQIIQTLGPERQKKVVGVNSILNHAALLNIARLHSPVIGLVCELPNVMETLTHIIRTYHASATIIPALFDDETRLSTLVEKADVIVVPFGVSQRLMALNPRIPVITVTFTIEQQSIDFLAHRIAELVDLERKAANA
jgi:DNA-binding transcriptional regulator YhcF (GntR family)